MAFQLILLSVVLFLSLYTQMPTELILVLILALCAVMVVSRHSRRHTHGAALSIDMCAQSSRMNPWHTGIKMALAVCCLFACIAVDSLLLPVYLFLGMSFLSIAVGKTPFRYYVALLATPAMFILLSCFAILAEVTAAPVGVVSLPFGRWFLCVTEQSQHLAIGTMLRALGAVSCLYMLSLSTPIYRIISALRKVGIPTVVIELMHLIYRYLFVLLETHQQMVHASTARLGYRTMRTSIRTILKNAFGLMFISFRRTSDLFAAMEARCYDGEIRFMEKSTNGNLPQILLSAGLLSGVIIIGVWG